MDSLISWLQQLAAPDGLPDAGARCPPPDGWRDELGRFLAQVRMDHALAGLAARLGAAATPVDVGQAAAEVLQQLVGWQRFVLRFGPAAAGEPPAVVQLGQAVDAAARLVLPVELRDERWLARIELQRQRPFADEATLVGQVAEQCSAALKRAAAEQALHEASRRVAAFGELAHRLNFVTTPREAGEMIARTADELIGWDACFFDLYDAASNCIQEMINIDTVGGVKQPVQGHHTSGPPGPLSCRMLDEGGFLLEQNVEQPLALDAFGDESRPSAAMLFVPARRGPEVVAFFSIQSYTPHAYNSEHLALLQSMADHCAGALVRIRLEEAMRVSEERYALAAQGANDGLWDWDLQTGRVHYSERWQSMLGLPPGTARPHIDEWLQRLGADDREAFEARIGDHVEGRSEHLQHEHRIRHADGRERWVLCRGAAVRDAAGRALRLAGSMTDITAAKQAQAELVRAACHDPLTGLANRALFMDRLQHNLLRSRRQPQHRFALLYIDLDRFKQVNDTLGHPVGDQLLQGIADRLQRHCRASDTVARLGGDEFTMILEGVGEAAEVQRVCERLLQDLTRPFVLGGQTVQAGASIGVAFCGAGCDSVEELLRQADGALYRAKEGGKGRFELVEPRVEARAAE